MQISNRNKTELTDTRIKKILLTRKYRQFFFPSLVAAIALSLSDFVDSIVVSNLLDTTALSIVNVCMPLMTLMATVYIMLALGGVLLYTERRGKSDPKGAETIFLLNSATKVRLISDSAKSFSIFFLIFFVCVVYQHFISPWSVHFLW